MTDQESKIYNKCLAISEEVTHKNARVCVRYFELAEKKLKHKPHKEAVRNCIRIMKEDYL